MATGDSLSSSSSASHSVSRLPRHCSAAQTAAMASHAYHTALYQKAVASSVGMTQRLNRYVALANEPGMAMPAAADCWSDS